jgi:glucose-6-phosphate isomerase
MVILPYKDRFIDVLRDRASQSSLVDPYTTSGDYLEGFLPGTHQALVENNRESVTITINSVSQFAVGLLVALFERAVGLYASSVNVNAYHQPGLETGKKAASVVIGLHNNSMSIIKLYFASRVTAPHQCRNQSMAQNLPGRRDFAFEVPTLA